uniref:Uncharacterized protein n=1 Tax=Meloidogyne incognita TaxID=6306 RepID=A0A914NT32_MELIC
MGDLIVLGKIILVRINKNIVVAFCSDGGFRLYYEGHEARFLAIFALSSLLPITLNPLNPLVETTVA